MDLHGGTTPAYPPIVEHPVRWGLLAAGHIANAFADAVKHSAGGRLVAVAARDGDRAAAFAERHGIPRHYAGYDELYADPEVDAIYISSTHPFHAEQALAAIAAGKHVLVEKPMTLTVADAEAVFEAARERGVLAMEAMWTRCLPVVRDVVERVRGGQIGRIRSVHAAFTVPLEYDESHRLFDPANGGGALLDLGVYPVTLAHLLAGHPTDLQVLGSTVTSGVDGLAALQWMTVEGGVVQVLCDSGSHGGTRTTVRGTGGWIELHGPVNDPESFTIHRDGQEPEWVPGERHHFLHEGVRRPAPGAGRRPDAARGDRRRPARADRPGRRRRGTGLRRRERHPGARRPDAGRDAHAGRRRLHAGAAAARLTRAAGRRAAARPASVRPAPSRDRPGPRHPHPAAAGAAGSDGRGVHLLTTRVSPRSVRGLTPTEAP